MEKIVDIVAIGDLIKEMKNKSYHGTMNPS